MVNEDESQQKFEEEKSAENVEVEEECQKSVDSAKFDDNQSDMKIDENVYKRFEDILSEQKITSSAIEE